MNKITKCTICGIMAIAIISQSSKLCDKCKEEKHEHIVENGFAHEALFVNTGHELTTTSGAFTSDL